MNREFSGINFQLKNFKFLPNMKLAYISLVAMDVGRA